MACQNPLPCSEVVASQDTSVLSSASKEDWPHHGQGQALILPWLALASAQRDSARHMTLGSSVL